jgi:hypothetical protein
MVMGVAMNDPDSGLIAGLQSRDLCALQLLVSRKYHRIARFLSLMMPGRAHEAEILATRVLRTAREMVDAVNERDILFDTWLHRLAITLWREQGRAERQLASGPTSPFGAMPEKVRLCLFLSAYQGMQSREIARIVSCSIAGVERRLRAARMIVDMHAQKSENQKSDKHSGIMADRLHAA